jgi:exonuclease III
MSEIQQELNNVKIITWNVNGIRSLYKDAVAMKQGLDSLDGDIICLQETRITRMLSVELMEINWTVFCMGL